MVYKHVPYIYTCMVNSQKKSIGVYGWHVKCGQGFSESGGANKPLKYIHT